MNVFSDDFIADLRAKHEGLPEWQRKLIYRVATGDHTAELRAEVEAWVAELPPKASAYVIPRLRSSGLFSTTYHELAVGHLLRRMGYVPEYEPSLGDQPPDWLVEPTEQVPTFAVEVFTIKEAPARTRGSMDELWGRLADLPIDAGLAIRLPHERLELTSRDTKRLALSVQAWLEGDTSPVGAVHNLGGVMFQVFTRDSGYSSLQLFRLTRAFWVDTAPLRERIKEKVKKHATLDLPYVVAVVADFGTGLGLDDLEDVVFGREAEDDAGLLRTEVVGQRLGRDSNGLFRDEKARNLSAVLWVHRGSEGWRMKALYNRQAQYPLPLETFEG